MKNFFLSILVLFSTTVFAQSNKVTFTAAADARQVLIGSYFDISFTLRNADGSNFKAPSFEGFTVLSGPNRSISTTMINGQYSKELTYSYTLQPQKIGTFTIDGATILANGKQMKTNSVSIEVLKGKSGATSQRDLQSRIAKEVFIKAIPHTEQAYIGQQIILDYKIYTSLGIETYNFVAESEYDGFFTQEIRRFPSGIIKEVIDGVEYSTKVLKRVALFPQQAGVLTIAPVEMRVAVSTDEEKSSRRRGFSFFQRRNHIPVTLLSEPVKINVHPLPVKAPPSFTGAVGKYHLNVAASDSRLSTDESITLQLSLSGDGDLKQVQAPPLSVDKAEVYEPRVIRDDFKEVNGKMLSEKVFEYLLLPKEPGIYRIAPEFSYFDTDSLKYITLRSSPLVFHVKKGTQGNISFEKKEVNPLAGAEIRPLKQGGKLYAKNRFFITSKLYWALASMPVFLFGLVVALRQKQIRDSKIDPLLLRRQKAAKLAQKHLAKAQSFMTKGDSRAFYDEVSRAALGYISDKLNIPNADLSKQNIKEKLIALNVAPKRIEDFIQLLKTCEMALYGGMSNSQKMKETYNLAADIIEGIEQEI
ncbi:MAG TPA: protein BatD [Phaeodactylibacter sp.]|nr:protein BatD [Phaeodactylibacter sp.]